jgi:hypothetical protein
MVETSQGLNDEDPSTLEAGMAESKDVRSLMTVVDVTIFFY